MSINLDRLLPNSFWASPWCAVSVFRSLNLNINPDGRTPPSELLYLIWLFYGFNYSTARKYMAGSQMLRQLYFAALDMELHTR